MIRAVCPGTFDPITFGHLDIISRAAHLYDEVIVAVAASRIKSPMFDLNERTELVCRATKDIPNVSVKSFDTLLVDFVREVDAQLVVKGLRALTDFEHESQQAALNYQLDPTMVATFIMSPPQYMHLSSSIVRELSSLHVDVSQLVPPCVCKALKQKLDNN